MKYFLLAIVLLINACAAEKALEETAVHLDFEVNKPSDKVPVEAPKPAETVKAAPAVKELLK